MGLMGLKCFCAALIYIDRERRIWDLVLALLLIFGPSVLLSLYHSSIGSERMQMRGCNDSVYATSVVDMVYCRVDDAWRAFWRFVTKAISVRLP